MSFIDDQIDDYLMSASLGYEDDYIPEMDDFAVLERRQRPSTPNGVDWRYEKGGVFSGDYDR